MKQLVLASLVRKTFGKQLLIVVENCGMSIIPFYFLFFVFPSFFLLYPFFIYCSFHLISPPHAPPYPVIPTDPHTLAGTPTRSTLDGCVASSRSMPLGRLQPLLTPPCPASPAWVSSAPPSPRPAPASLRPRPLRVPDLPAPMHP